MADKKLNAVSTASDGAYIYAEDASGNQIKISKADLASVVAGIIGFNNSVFKNRGDMTNLNLDTYTSNGVWAYYSSLGTLTSSPGFQTFVLVVFAVNNYHGVQIAFCNAGANAGKIKYRLIVNRTTETSWRTLI